MLGSLNSLQSTSCVLFNPAIPAIEEDWDLRQKNPRFWKYSKCAGSQKGCSIARKKAAKAVRYIVYDVMDGRAQQHLFTPLGRGRKVIQSSYFETSRWLNEALLPCSAEQSTVEGLAAFLFITLTA